ncbi:putative UDP-N-acetylglucosamine--peptide N-acetylglucosaminyltransferase SPINDLY [Hibiscus syriacus]|uniref:UDP-N-acetylglucosamine--peptide N-acetylglucosaminyltransferase SPINDLY n=1 Tax=Hibiscus syriacus TaxID=106335 RepID=A0A6A3CR48_HIBSY|nr:putative UDP-N-acetylglucosamine--peptide N-acetylglucosaminyltransferase SPINDLY [Hibiscus syriacus]
MVWTEKDVNGSEKDLIAENGFLKDQPSSPGPSTLTADVIPTQKAFEGKDALSYANILWSRNKFVDALAIYSSVLEKENWCVEAHIGKGICLQMQNMARPAFESFAEAIKLDPRNACALTHCGILYKDEGHLTDAAESYQKALRADPSYKPAAECLAIVLTDLGTSLKLAGNTQEGIQKYYEALKIIPHYSPAYYNLGVVYSELMQYDTALCCYEKAALERPMYAEAYCNMGVIYKNRGDLESAIACYERCLAVSPNFEIAKNNMAIALTDLGTKVKLEGDINQGVACYKKALYYNWHYADAMYNLGVAYGEMLKFDMVSNYLSCIFLEVHDSLRGTGFLIVTWIAFWEREREGDTTGDQIPMGFPPCHRWPPPYVSVRIKREMSPEAFPHPCFRSKLALSIKPNFSQSLNNLGVVYTVQGKMDAAASMIEKAIIANPTYAEAYNNLGVLYRDAGNISMVVTAYEQCLKIDPNSRNAGQVPFHESYIV